MTFKIHSNGAMSNLMLVNSCGIALADQSALKAVENAAPFRPLPIGAPPEKDFDFTFDYKPYKGSASRASPR